MSNTWCPLPWIHSAVRSNGDIRVCCHSNASKGKGTYRKENGDAFRANRDNLDESRNSNLAKNIRKEMLDGNWPDSCIRCKREDESGVRSRRVYETSKWDDDFDIEDAKNITEDDGTIDVSKVPVLYYDLRFGNLCNLKCRMCGPTDSSMWYEDQIKIWGDTFKDSHGVVQLIKNDKGKYVPEDNVYDWVHSDSFWGQVEKNIPSLKEIHTVGGEPMMIDEHYDLLQKCVDSGYAKNILVEYNSNIVNIPQRAWDIWKHFRKIEIGASIDGVGKINDYIRFPSKWKAMEKNIKKLDETNDNYNVWLSATVQVYNVLYLTDFMKWKLEQNYKKINHSLWHAPIITTHPLHNPSFLNIKILPIEVKNNIIEKFNEFYLWLDEYLERENIAPELHDRFKKNAHKILDGYADFMMKDDWSHLMPKFWTYTKELDEVRNQRFEDELPELYELIKDCVND